jgi:hypothetical protein
MARKILEGVALYANYKIEPSQIHDVQFKGTSNNTINQETFAIHKMKVVTK